MRAFVIGALIAGGCGVPASRADDAPRAAVTVDVGGAPADVAAGDLDGDGALDLVAAVGEDRAIAVRLARGARWVAGPGAALELAVAPHLVALADLDDDGDLDVVATGHDAAGVSVWLGDGTGAFTEAAGSPFAAFDVARPHTHGLAVGDVDRDGDPDVVVVDQDAGAASVLLADRRGRLVRAAGAPIEVGGSPYPPALGDLDGDGALDLVVPLVIGDAVAILRGDGAGGFAPAPGSPAPVAIARPYAVGLGDLDGDGALDAVVTHDDEDRITVLAGDGRGGLGEATRSPIALGRRIWRPVLADVDGDGRADLVGAAGDAIVVVPGGGKGLGRPRRVDGDGWRVIVADLDHDGAPELVTAADDGVRIRQAGTSGKARGRGGASGATSPSGSRARAQAR